MGKDKSRLESALKEGSEFVIPLLRAVQKSSDAFPPLKSAVSLALVIGETVIAFKSNKKDWADLAQFVQGALAYVIQCIPGSSEPQALQANIQTLAHALQNIHNAIVTLRTKQLRERLFDFLKDPDKIAGMRKQVEDAVGLFNLSTTISMSRDVGEILRSVKGKFGDKIALGSLPYAEGASWDLSRVCLPGTREKLLEDIWTWATKNENVKGAQIFLLADVAGAGKSAIAHTFAQRCHSKRLLASSFFFDREIAGRNGPQKLFSTIARDLANVDEHIAEQISIAVQKDSSLPTAPISRQFEELILKPSHSLTRNQPVIIVLDALDEGYNHSADLLAILADNVSFLPRCFRVFVTTRQEEDIEMFLHGKSHIERRSMRIHEQSNMTDIAVYVRHRLKQIAARRGLPADWPQQKSLKAFVNKAEGLFIWAATVCDFLVLQVDPSKHLDALLSDSSLSGLRAEVKMDKLYSAILSTCNWEDEDFVDGYQTLVGAIMAAKVPLSASALQSLCRPMVRVVDILRPLGSLLTGLSHDAEPIRILHQSFRDFLTVRTRSSTNGFRFYVCEKEHSEGLALMCLVVMNVNLKRDMCGISDLSKRTSESPGFQDLVARTISEEVGYSCRFWMDHIADAKAPLSPLITDALRIFLTTRLLPWMEVMALKTRLQDAINALLMLQNCLQSTVPDTLDLTHLISDAMRFLQQFSVVIMQNPLHIYASALPFTPTESALRKAYIPLFEDIPLIVEGLDAHWPSVVSSVGGPRNSQAEESIRSIAFAPDGSRVALGSDNAVIRIWYPKGGTHVDLKGHTMEVTSVIFSPDGTIMASCSYDRTVCIWEATAQTMSLMHRLTSVHDDGPLLCVAFSTDGCKVAAGSFAGPAYVWDLDAIDISKRSSRLTRHTAWICSVVFLPENGLLASCSSDGMICIWDTHTLACIRQPSHRHLYGVSSITFSTCGSRIAICFVDGSLKFQAVAESRLMPSCMSQISIVVSDNRSRRIHYSTKGPPRFYNTNTDSPLFVHGIDDDMIFTFAVFCSNSIMIAARCKDGNICLCDLSKDTPTLRIIATDMGKDGPVAFGANSSQIIFCRPDGSLYIRSIGTEVLSSALLPSAVGHLPLMLSLSSDGQKAAALYSEDGIFVYNLQNGGIFQHPFANGKRWVNSMAFSLDSEILAIGTSDGYCCVTECASGKLLCTFIPDKFSAIAEVRFFDSGLESRTVKGQMEQWFPETGQLIDRIHGSNYFEGAICCVFSPDGSYIASGHARHGQLDVWDSCTGIHKFRKYSRLNEEIISVAFSADSSQVGTGSTDGIVRIWGVVAQQNERYADFDTAWWSLAVTHNGRRIAGIRAPRTLLLCDPEINTRIISILPQQEGYRFSPDGVFLASCSQDRRFHVQHADTGRVINHSPHLGEPMVILIGFAPNSKHIVTVSLDFLIRVWDAQNDFTEGHHIGRSVMAETQDEEKERAKKIGVMPTQFPPRVVFTADSRRLIDRSSRMCPRKIRIWDLDYHLHFNCNVEGHFAVSDDGLQIARVRLHGNKLQVLDVSTQRVIYEGDDALDVSTLALSADGSLVAGGSIHGVRVWNLDAGRSVWRFLKAPTYELRDLAFSTDRLKVAACDHNGNLIAWRIHECDVIIQEHYPIYTRLLEFEQQPVLGHFLKWINNIDDPNFAQSGLIPMDNDGWIRTRDFKRVLWVPIDYGGYMVTGGRTAIIRRFNYSLITISMPQSQNHTIS